MSKLATRLDQLGGKRLHGFHYSLVSRSVCMPQRRPGNVQEWQRSLTVAWNTQQPQRVQNMLGQKCCKCIRSTAEADKALTPVQTSIKPHTYKLIDIPFSPAEWDVVQAQALQAVILTNSAFRLFEDPEMQELFRLFHTAAPSVLPSGKSVGGKLLNDAAQSVEQKLLKTLKGQYVGLV